MFCDVNNKVAPRVVAFPTVTWIFREGELLMGNPRNEDTEAFRSQFQQLARQSQHLSPSRLSLQRLPHAFPSQQGQAGSSLVWPRRKGTGILRELSCSQKGSPLCSWL